jgi:hypothetical protein
MFTRLALAFQIIIETEKNNGEPVDSRLQTFYHLPNRKKA